MAKQTTKKEVKVLTLTDKLVAIQTELHAPKNQRNNFGKYNYRSCEDILEAVKPLLNKYGCTVTISDSIQEVSGIVYVDASVSLEDSNNNDKYIIVSAQAGINPNRKGMDIAQSFGASSSYARKYALNGLFLIDDNKDPDTGITPSPTTDTKPTIKKTIPKVGVFTDAIRKKLADSTTERQVTDIWLSNVNLHENTEFTSIVKTKGTSLKGK